ncbi:MAG: biotin/lipoyl-binding protein [Candidatus Verstraetearchaeota archaeon]|nr:biotin/lipoyl-binding protein [Candidatus Verstraetearchaeota archaeon]
MKFQITIKNRKKEVEVQEVNNNLLKVKVNGKEYEVKVEGLEEPKMEIEAYYEVEDIELKEEIININSPLPGVISSVLVKEGDVVKKGDVILYIESMKMLNEIVAPKNGIIKEILKKEGDFVNIGDLLVKMKIGE